MDSLLTVMNESSQLVISVPNGPVARRILPRKIDTPPHHFLRWNRRALTIFMARHGLVILRLEDRGLLNWQFTLERIIAKMLPRLRERYRDARLAGGKRSRIITLIRRNVLRLLALWLLPAALLVFRQGFAGLLVILAREPENQRAGA